MMILTILFSLIIGCFLLFLLRSGFINFITSIIVASIPLFISLYILTRFYRHDIIDIYTATKTVFPITVGDFSKLFEFGFYDVTSLYFVILTSFLVLCCMAQMVKHSNAPEYKRLAILLLLIEFLLYLIFLTTNLGLFYIFFEALLVPMYLLIGMGGSRERKIHATYMFFFYTLGSSLLFLVSILYIYIVVGSLEYDYIFAYNFSENEQIVLWLCFFLSFASKVPMYPFHIWLPEAHVEAPTVGSVLLAGILLKLGVYGMIRFNLTLFPFASLFYSPLVYLLSCMGIIYASMTALRQTDFKRIIAYSSIAHMNLVTLGIFSFNQIGIDGAILQSLSHGYVAGGLFLLIGVLYDRYHSRFLYYYGGLVHMMPFYAIFFLIFTLSNIALPGTSSFVGEFLLLTGIYKINAFTAAVGALGVILCGAYSLWLYNRIIFGNLKIDYTLKFKDITLQEFLVLIPLFLLIFIIGIYPTLFTKFLQSMSSTFVFIFN